MYLSHCFSAYFLKVGYIQIIDRKNIYDKSIRVLAKVFFLYKLIEGKYNDRSGNVLATDLTTASLVVVPSQIKDQATTALELSKNFKCRCQCFERKIK